MPDFQNEKLSYERIPLRKADTPARGFKIPTDVIDALGNDDVPGACILADVLGIHVLYGGVVGAEALARIGDGDEKTGRRVLQKFIADIRAKGRHATT